MVRDDRVSLSSPDEPRVKQGQTGGVCRADHTAAAQPLVEGDHQHLVGSRDAGLQHSLGKAAENC